MQSRCGAARAGTVYGPPLLLRCCISAAAAPAADNALGYLLINN